MFHSIIFHLLFFEWLYFSCPVSDNTISNNLPSNVIFDRFYGQEFIATTEPVADGFSRRLKIGWAGDLVEMWSFRLSTEISSVFAVVGNNSGHIGVGFSRLVN